MAMMQNGAEVIAGYTVLRERSRFNHKRILEVKRNHLKFALKIFQPASSEQFEDETIALGRLDHPNIIKLVQKSDPSYQLNYHFFVSELAVYGNLCDCLQKIRNCNEDVTRTLIKQVIEGLKHAQDKEILHQSLQGFDLLIDENRSIKLCGWSRTHSAKDSSALGKLVFSVGEIIVLMLTGHPAFTKHDNNDLLYKHISLKGIDKFWQSVGKRIQEKIPDQVVELVKNIFLDKECTLDTILKSDWIQKGRILEPYEIKAYFKERQTLFDEKQLQKRKSYEEQKLKFKKMREEMYQANRGKEDDSFINDYETCNLTACDLPEKKITPNAILIDEKLPFVIAWLKKLFNEAYQTKTSLVFPPSEFRLSQCSTTINDNTLLFKLQFDTIGEEEQVMEENQLLVRVRFFREKQGSAFAEVTVEGQQQGDEYYSNRLKRLVERELQLINEQSKLEERKFSNGKEETLPTMKLC